MTSLSCSSWDSCPLQLAGRQVKHNVYDDRTFTIPVEQMLYAFTRTAAIRGLIDAPYVRAPSFHRSHLYVRTVKGVFFVYFRSLAELLEHLGAMHFLLLHHGLCVNPHLEMEFDLRSKRKRIGIAINEKETEWLIVSRRHVVSVRELFGLRPQRRKLKQKYESKLDRKITGEGFGRTEFCEKS